MAETERKIAFYHRNSSDGRKEAILKDLQLPLGSKDKNLICVVATVSLGKIDFKENRIYTFYKNI